MMIDNNRLKVALLLAALLFVAAAPAATLAQETMGEEALSRSHLDSQLKWNPCPPIFPKGCEITVLRGDPVNGRADVFLRAPANYKFPAHWHTSPEHMILVAGQLQVTYENQKPAVLKKGSYAYGPAKAKHEARCLNAGRVCCSSPLSLQSTRCSSRLIQSREGISGRYYMKYRSMSKGP